MFHSNQISSRQRRFTFRTEAQPAQFEVLRFNGEEALSMLYRFDILLACSDSEIDTGKLVGHAAHFTLDDGVKGGKATAYHGLIKAFTYEYQISGWAFYRAILVPKLWRLTSYHLSEVYQGKNRAQVFSLIAERAGFAGRDFEIRSNFPQEPRLDYVCQYQESYLNFIARWQERLGGYWWYEETDGHEKTVFSNTRMAHKDEALALRYQSAGELDADIGQVRRIQHLKEESRCVPRRVTLTDYTPQQAGLDIKASAAVSDDGIGEVHLYGENLKNNAEASVVARLRAEGLQCSSKQYIGSSTATGLRCGHFIDVESHPRRSFNRRYLLTRVRHRGSQAGLMLDGLGLNVPDEMERARDSHAGGFYHADFCAIPSDVQFRPRIVHPWPKIEGTLTAFIDAEGSGKYAEINERGEYKVQLPFDASDKAANHGSAWIRMATPYAGSDHGMHFPLLKGTEVLLSFINGDPDQPVIVAAVPNSLNPNVVTNANHTQSRIRSLGGNQLTMEDRQGGQSMLLSSPTHNTWISLGAAAQDKRAATAASANTSAPQSTGVSDSHAGASGGLQLHTENDIQLVAQGNQLQETGGDQTTRIGGISYACNYGAANTDYLGGKYSITHGVYSNVVLGEYVQTILGNKNEFTTLVDSVYGAKAEYVMLSKADMWTLSKFELGLGFKIEVRTGMKMEKWSGMKTEPWDGFRSEIGAGIRMEFNTGIKMEKLNLKIANTTTEIKQVSGLLVGENLTKMDTALISLANKKTNIDIYDVNITESQADVWSKKATVIQCQIEAFMGIKIYV
jgi:type VI secretion system secreted protein VgrG